MVVNVAKYSMHGAFGCFVGELVQSNTNFKETNLGGSRIHPFLSMIVGGRVVGGSSQLVTG